MKNIQIIDGARNSVFEIYEVEDSVFEKIFPNRIDIAFIDDLAELTDYSKEANERFWIKFYSKKKDKKVINGIHGTLHLLGSNCDASFFPDRKEGVVLKQCTNITVTV